MTINSVNNTLVSGGQNPQATTNSGDVMGKEQFLELLVAQLQNQDPLNPQDPTEFTSQLAQYSQVEQMMNMNKGIQSLSSMTHDMERLSALGMIGKDVMVETSTFKLSDSNGVTLGYDLERHAAEGKLHVLDGSGRTVKSFDLEQLREGQHHLTWDGKDASGANLPPGNYFLSVVALDKEEKQVGAQALVRTRVDGIDVDEKSSRVLTDNGEYSLANVLSVLGG